MPPALGQGSNAEGICTPRRLQASHDAAVVEEACDGGSAPERVSFDPADTVAERRDRAFGDLAAAKPRACRVAGAV